MTVSFTDATFGAGNYSAGAVALGTFTGTSVLSTLNVTSVTFTGTLTTPGILGSGSLDLNVLDTTTPIVATDVTYVGFAPATDGSGDPTYFLSADVAGVATPVTFAITTDPSTPLAELSVLTGVNTSDVTAPPSTNTNPPCFVSGTLIRTIDGDVRVEDLKVGDVVLTASGEARPIVWLGRRTLSRETWPDFKAAWPVRVSTGAFGEALPASDLYLSPAHAVCVNVVDEVFIPVGLLVNGATVAPVEVEEVTYWHVELESHDVLIANGLPAESYMDVGNRSGLEARYGRIGAIDRAIATTADYVRPFVSEGPVIEAVRARLTARAHAMGWTITHDMEMRLLVDGRPVDVDVDGDLARFLFPAEARDVRLVSHTFNPARCGSNGDCRDLGVTVTSLHVGDGLRQGQNIPLDHSALTGFHPDEGVSGSSWRWTDGTLTLDPELWDRCRSHVILRIGFVPRASWRWIPPAAQAASAKVSPLRRVA